MVVGRNGLKNEIMIYNDMVAIPTPLANVRALVA